MKGSRVKLAGLQFSKARTPDHSELERGVGLGPLCGDKGFKMKARWSPWGRQECRLEAVTHTHDLPASHKAPSIEMINVA